MKSETMLKVLKRYKRVLESMHIMAIIENELQSIIAHYEFDIQVFEQAIKELERSNTES